MESSVRSTAVGYVMMEMLLFEEYIETTPSFHPITHPLSRQK